MKNKQLNVLKGGRQFLENRQSSLLAAPSTTETYVPMIHTHVIFNLAVDKHKNHWVFALNLYVNKPGTHALASSPTDKNPGSFLCHMLLTHYFEGSHFNVKPQRVPF